MNRRFFGCATLEALGKRYDGSWLRYLDKIVLDDDGVTASAHRGGPVSVWLADPAIRMTWHAIESWDVAHASVESIVWRRPRSKTVIRSFDGASISFVSKTVVAEQMADIARGELPAKTIREDDRSS